MTKLRFARLAAVLAVAGALSFAGCGRPSGPAAAAAATTAAASPAADRLAGSSREDVNGWIRVRLQGPPRRVGYQHGWHLAAEIEDLLQAMAFYFEGSTKRPWSFYRDAAERMFWPKLRPAEREEIEGIVEGLRARRPGSARDRADIAALNGWIELAWYYVPALDARAAGRPVESKAPGMCSGFIAVGSWTKDGRVVMGHNNWSDYIMGERWNVVLDIAPDAGARVVMDAMPGYIHSGDDFVMTSAGLVITETTMSGFKGFREDGTPEFARARRAAQFAASIDDFVRIMSEDNNGAYANDWLVGDLKTGEIARFELGLKNQRLWRTRDGCFIGSNFPLDEKLIAEETSFDPADPGQSVYVRKARWEKLMADHKGRIDAELGKAFEADHFDMSAGAEAANGRTLCGHVDLDDRGTPEMTWGPNFPAGAVQGKVTTAALAETLSFWGRMGHPCGRDFIAADYFARNPAYAWEGKYLRDMKANPWTLFDGTR